MNILYNHCWRTAKAIPKQQLAVQTGMAHGTRVYQATAVDYQSLRGRQY